MNLNELADLCVVVEHLKTVIITSRFPQETSTLLKKKLAELEQKFVNEVTVMGPMVDLKDIHNRIQAAKNELNVKGPPVPVQTTTSSELKGSVVVEAKQDEVPLQEEVSSPTVSSEDGAVFVNPPADDNMNSRLAEEKKKLVAKGKRKVNK